MNLLGVIDTLLNKGITVALGQVDNLTDKDYLIRYNNRRNGFHINNYRFEKDQLAFIHLPKTGGTTLHTLLHQAPQCLLENLQKHRPVSLHCPPGEYRYITFLRDPVERVWSYFNMAHREDPDNPYHRISKKGLRYFIEHCWEVRNMACRYIAGAVDREADPEMLNHAWQNLERFYFVGCFETFSEDVKALEYLLGVERREPELPNLRQSKKEAITPEDRQVITEYNQYDIELYQRFINGAKKT